MFFEWKHKSRECIYKKSICSGTSGVLTYNFQKAPTTIYFSKQVDSYVLSFSSKKYLLNRYLSVNIILKRTVYS